MISLEHKGFFPLTKYSITDTAPERAGVYTLAIQLPNGVHKTFFSRGSENIHRSLTRLLDGDTTELSSEALDYLQRYGCYFTFFVILDADQREAITKMLSSTCDPFVQLTMTACS